MSKFYFLLFCILISLNSKGQEQWSLMSCIDHAVKNNVSLQLNKITVDQSAITLKESKYKMLPNLNGSIFSGSSFGRNVDPTTNSFTTSNILYSNYSLSSSVALFQGGLIRNTIKQNDLNLQSGFKDYEQATNDLALSISVYYLNVLQSQERLHVADKNREISKLQLEQINKLIKAGAKPEADALEIQSQLARAEQIYVVAENTLELAWLTLKQEMRLDPQTKMILEPLTEEQFNSVQIQNYSYEELIKTATEHRAGIQAARIRLDAAKLGEKIARSFYYPSVSLNASIGSRYSNAARLYEPYDSKETLSGTARFANDSFPVSFEYPFTSYREGAVIPFKDQFDQFLGYGAGISINIPIFNNYSTKAAVEKSKLNSKQTELQLELQKEKLGQDIYQAMTNVKAAIKEYEASQNAFLAAKSSFEKTQKRFDIGMSNVFELNQIQTNYLNAQTTFLISKYDLVFKQKILDYYAGKQIRM